MHKLNTIALSFALVATAACTGEADIDTTARGTASYEDAATNRQGEAQQPAQPDPQPMYVEIIVEGTGQMSGLEPQCSLDGATGSFDALFAGEADVSDDGAYVAGLASGDAFVTTPSGCEVPEVQITAVGDVTVRATIEATTANCTSYCEAKARHHGEAMCGAEPGQASCRAEAEAEYAASCTTTCTTTAHVIAAETALSAQALAELNARSITGAALGELSVDLTFDRIEDADGETVDEAP